MVGFIKRLFSGGSQSGGAFYLEPDDAKTLGDIEYMRSERTVKRTFPKMGDDAEGGELTLRVSATKAEETTDVPQTARTAPAATFQSFRSATTPAAAPTSESSSEGATVPTPPPSSSSNSSMDMFRNMAKDIRKKK